MRNSIAVVIILMFSLIACKQDNKTNSSSTEIPVEEIKPGANFANIPGPITNTNLREKGQSLIDYRIEHSEKKFWTIIESGIWEIAFVFDGEKMNSPSKDTTKWLDFGQDGRFEYGEGTNVVTAGQYHYDWDKGELVLLDDDKRAGPNMWKVNMSGSAMVLLGNTELTSNAYQIKLDKWEKRPQ